MELKLKIEKRPEHRENLALEDPFRWEIGTSKGLGLERDGTGENTSQRSNRKRHVITVGVNTMGYAKALHGALGAAI